MGLRTRSRHTSAIRSLLMPEPTPHPVPESLPPPSGPGELPPETRTGSDPVWLPAMEQTAADLGGRYTNLQPHARGGLGEVFRAHDAELNRPVALKRIRAEQAGNSESQRRFLLEAEITARLEHPGVVPVYGLVRDDRGRPCYVMRFIQGQTL